MLPPFTLASVKVLGLSGDVMVKQLACLTSSQGPEHQQVVNDVGLAQDHSLLRHGHQCSARLQKHISKPAVAGDYVTPVLAC